jgi:hypothetical protein
MPRHSYAEDKARFLKLLNKLGREAQNKVLCDALGWGEDHYYNIRQQLIDDERVVKRRGPGGKVILLDETKKEDRPKSRVVDNDKGTGGSEHELPKKHTDVASTSHFAPAVRGDTSTVAINIQSFMDQYDAGKFSTPDYQRDSSQWDAETKSLFIESLINGITVPPLIVFPAAPDRNEIVDGQQRVMTIRDFLANNFTLSSEDYVEYRDNVTALIQGRTFEELQPDIQRQIKSYVLTIIKLPSDLDLELRLEVFRRINKAGVPLSPQDLRLAVFCQSRRVNFIRLAGIYDQGREGSANMLKHAADHFNLIYPWKESRGWKVWWTGSAHAIGQAPSQMFLYYVVCRDLNSVETLLNSEKAQKSLSVKYDGSTASVLDIYAARLQYEDLGGEVRILANMDVLERWFREFEHWFNELAMIKVPRIEPNASTKVALFIAAATQVWGSPDRINEKQWDAVQSFLTKSPRDIAAILELDYPIAKGKWPGQKQQIDATMELCQRIASL